MLREKLFLSIVFLILSMLAGLACVPLFGTVLNDPAMTAKLGAATLLLLPLLSLGLMWKANPGSNYVLRRYSFLSWAAVLCLIGVSNFVLIKDQANSNTTILMLGVVCAAISLHAKKKADKKKSTTATVNEDAAA
ncbi:hypothetical protein [Undibacterium flavidum]|uniref:MerC mercury resistance protein n=1 Tax=Undibacterium flavidum TaxID=2762297 RepID=A0ABR6YH31_9BURK|nr:hypothetical protein [Undibacterium flavidum]MBC3875894.1 hypothetical protein [Undibacterium flavidum]